MSWSLYQKLLQSANKQHGAELVSIHSYQENQFIRSLGGNEDIFIDLRESNSEGIYAWSDGSTLAYTNGHVRYINILTWLQGFQGKLLNLALFSLYPSLFWELRDKRNLENLQFWPESIGAMLEYWYIERGLLGRQRTSWPIAWNQRLYNSTGADTKWCSTVYVIR